MSRIDPARLSFHLIPLPKGVKGSRAASILGDVPAGSYSKSATKGFLCTTKGAIPLGLPTPGAPVGPGALHPGTHWAGKQQIPQPVVWTVGEKEAIGCLLPMPGFTSGNATAAEGADVVGTGERPGDAPSRALLWKGGATPIELGDPGDPDASSAAYAISGGIQGGRCGGMNGGACIWRGDSASLVRLHPKGVDASWVRGVSPDQQVGEFEVEEDTGAAKRAALWQGSADSFADLTPDGAANAVARGVAAGFQAGWVEGTPMSQLFRAWLWAGSAAESLDLHPMVGGEWTASMVTAVRQAGDRLILLGTVEQRQPDGYRALLAEQACWWEYRLG